MNTNKKIHFNYWVFFYWLLQIFGSLIAFKITVFTFTLHPSVTSVHCSSLHFSKSLTHSLIIWPTQSRAPNHRTFNWMQAHCVSLKPCNAHHHNVLWMVNSWTLACVREASSCLEVPLNLEDHYTPCSCSDLGWLSLLETGTMILNFNQSDCLIRIW